MLKNQLLQLISLFLLTTSLAYAGQKVTGNLEVTGLVSCPNITTSSGGLMSCNSTTYFTTAGRSLTNSSSTIDADAETYTDTKCIRFETPVAADDLKSIWFAKQAATLTSLWCESDQTVTAMLQIDDGTPTDVDTVDLSCDSTPPEDTALNGDATMASGDRLDLDVASVSGTPTWVTICWTMAYDD